MHFTARMTGCLTLALALSGCSDFSMPSFSMPTLPGIHKFDVQQGNVITQDMIDQLKPGMTKSQVRFIMGTPLIADTFNQDRWDYYYSLTSKKGGEVRERVAIFFDNEKLIGFKGDYLPNANNPE
jgi:outer membrane protein assembly factor BamE